MADESKDVQEMGKGIDDMLSKLQASAQAGLNVVIDKVGAIGDEIQKVQVAGDGLVTKFDEIKVAASKTFDESAGKISEWSSSVSSSLETSGEETKKFSDILSSGVGDSGAESELIKLKDAFLELADGFGKLYDMDLGTVFGSLSEGVTGNIEPLKEIGDKLLNKCLMPIGAWMDENRPIVEAAAKAVKGFMIAWEVTKLMAFIEMSGGLIETLKAVKLAIRALTIEKIADKAETVALTALYAKDFLVSLPKATVELANQAKQFAINTAAKIADKKETIEIGLLYAKDFIKKIADGTVALVQEAKQFALNTAAKIADKAETIALTALKVKDAVAQWAMNAATGAWSVVSTIATAATTAFGAAVAFLTSPIGLVILAIAAVIAIGVLLYTHWSEISAYAVQVWGIIQGAFAQFAGWLNDVFTVIWTTVFTVFGNILNTFVSTVTYIWSVVLSAFSQFGSWLSGIFAVAWTTVFGTFQNILNGFFTTVSYIWSVVQGAFTQFNDWLNGIFAVNWTNQFGAFGNIINGFLATVRNVWDAIKLVFGGIIDFVAGVFSGDWSRAWQGVKDIFSGIMNGLGAVIKAPLNAMISLINAAIDGINSICIDIPDWDILPDSIQGKSISFSIPKINYLYTGGVFDKPTLLGNTVVGDKYKGSGSQREWVLPDQLLRATIKEVVGLELGSLFNRLSQTVGYEIASTTANVVANNSMYAKDNAIGEVLMGGGSKVIENHIHVDIEGREVAKAVAPYQQEFHEYQKGR